MNLILKNHQSPGDILMLTSLVRDMKKAYPQHKIRIKTSADSLFENNPNIEPWPIVQPRVYNTRAKALEDRSYKEKGWLEINVHYSDEPQLGKTVDNPWSINKCGLHRKHFMYGMIGYINDLLNIHVRPGELKPDLYLTDKERGTAPNVLGQPYCKGVAGSDEHDYWVVVPGGKPDYPRKIWAKRNWEELFALLSDVNFVQIGGREKGHIKPEFEGPDNVLNLTGHTTLREALSLIYNAKGVISPITFAMHAAAAFDKRCIVIAGGGEHHTWEAYPGHDYLHTCGALECCKDGGCWNGDCKNKAPDGEQECMKLITAEMVAELMGATNTVVECESRKRGDK